jgi:hypothetical protein
MIDKYVHQNYLFQIEAHMIYVKIRYDSNQKICSLFIHVRSTKVYGYGMPSVWWWIQK